MVYSACFDSISVYLMCIRGLIVMILSICVEQCAIPGRYVDVLWVIGVVFEGVLCCEM